MADHPMSVKERDAKFEAEDDLRTLIRAGEIKGDAKRHGRAMKEARAQKKALAAVGKADG